MKLKSKKIFFISWPFGKQTATAPSIGDYRKAKKTAGRTEVIAHHPSLAFVPSAAASA